VKTHITFLDRRSFCGKIVCAGSIALSAALTAVPRFSGAMERADDEFTIIKGWVLTKRDVARGNDF